MIEFSYTTSHEFFYSNKQPVPLGEIAESLLALERIAKISPKVLEELTKVSIERVEVYVEELHSGSLLEKVAIRFFFQDEAGLNAFVDKVKDKVGPPGMSRNVLIGAVLLALVGYGSWLAAKTTNVPSQTSIEANNNVIINIGAESAGMTADTFKAIVEAAVSDKKALAEQSVKFIKAARADPAASIRMDGSDKMSIPAEVIAATPVAVEFKKQDKTEQLPDVDLHIRATNLDSRKTGWAGLIPGKIDRRIRLQIDPSVEIEDVAGKFSLRANVVVFHKLDKDGKHLVPDYILLRDVIKD